MAPFKVGMGQLLVEGGEPEANLERAVNLVSEGAREECRVVVLPEALDLGWTDPSARELAKPLPGEYSDLLAGAARDHSTYVVAGLTERAGDRIYNSAVLLSPTGELLARHRKINVLGIAQDLYSIGNTLNVVETPLATMGVDICADNFPDSVVLAHALARMGCNLLLSPSAWAVDADHDNGKSPYGGTWEQSFTSLGKMFDLITIGVSNVGWMTGGPWKGRKCIGCSLAVGPGGRVLAKGPYGADAQTLIPVEVDPAPPIARGTGISGALAKRGFDVAGALEGRYYKMKP